MRLIDHTTPPYTARSPRAAESFGLIARTRPALLQRAGEVTRPAAADPIVLMSPALAAAARADRARWLGKLGAELIHTVVERCRAALADWRRARDARATWQALRQLDARTLHDLGFHHSELRSVALDVARRDAASDRRIRFDVTPTH